MDRLRSGERGVGWLESVDEACEKERSPGRDQIWMFESEDPERRKLEVGSTAREVID